jgi:hypothetical protein
VRGQCELRIERSICSEAVNFKHTSGRCCVGRAANRSDPGDFQIDFERIYRRTLQTGARTHYQGKADLRSGEWRVPDCDSIGQLFGFALNVVWALYDIPTDCGPHSMAMGRSFGSSSYMSAVE